jgi:deoxyribonuclease-4
MYIGSHVSIRKGYAEAAKAAYAMGANAFQYFPKNPRSIYPKSFDPQDAAACAQFCSEHGLLSIGHAPYPLNLAAAEDMQNVMVAAILNGLEITHACGSIGLVVHFGKYKGAEMLQGYQNIIGTVNKALRQWHGNALLLLENQAGEGTPMGTTMEELVQIRSLSDYPDKIGFCLDTCHAFASGLWHGHDWADVQEKGDKLGYLAQLKTVHLNDSRYACGSHRDRHANIGHGFIGLEPFKDLLRSSYVRNIPVVLETSPAADGTHRDEIALVKVLAGSTER